MRAIAFFFAAVWVLADVAANPLGVVLVKESPDSIEMQFATAFPQPLVFRVVREDDGTPVAGVRVNVGYPGQCPEGSGGCPSLGWFDNVVLNTPVHTINKDFTSDCTGFIRTSSYTAGTFANNYTIRGIVDPARQDPGVDLLQNDLAARQKTINVTQGPGPGSAPPPLPAHPTEFCGVTDVGGKCSALMFANGFEQGLCSP